MTLHSGVLLLLVACAALLCPSYAWSIVPRLPGFRVEAKAAGLQKVADALAPKILDDIRNSPVDNIESTTDVPVLGKIWFKVSSIKVERVGYDKLSLTFPNKAKATATGGYLRIRANFEYKKVGFPYIPFGDGKVTGDFSQCSFGASCEFDALIDGKLHAKISDPLADLKELDITVSGSFFSWLYNLLSWAFRSTLRNTLESNIRSMILEDANDIVNDVLRSFPTSIDIDEHAKLNYALANAPTFHNSEMLRIDSAGEFRKVSQPGQHAPFPRTPFPDSSSERQDIGVYVDQYLIQSGLWVYHEAGVFSSQLVDADLPDGFPFKLHTSFGSWNLFVPELPRQHPNKPLMLGITSLNTPVVSIGQERSSLAIKADIVFHVPGSSQGSWDMVFGVEADAVAGMVFQMVENVLKFQFKEVQFKMKLTQSTLGDIDVSKLEQMVHTVLNLLVLPQLNNRFKDGIPLPVVEGFEFSNSKLEFGTGYLHANADIRYTPPDSVQIDHLQNLK